jgi:hypothetical protein
MAGDTTADFDFDAWVRASREAQGLPPTIEDQTIITRVLILAGLLARQPRSPVCGLGGTSESHPAEEAPLSSPARP